MTLKLHGLVAATHTPFDADDQLNLTAVAKQAEHLHRVGVNALDEESWLSGLILPLRSPQVQIAPEAPRASRSARPSPSKSPST